MKGSGESGKDLLSRFALPWDEIRESLRVQEMGPYEYAEWELHNDPDEELWVRCMVEARQDVDEATSLYVEKKALALERKASEEESRRRAEIAEFHRRERNKYYVGLRKLRWLSRRNGAVAGGVLGVFVPLFTSSLGAWGWGSLLLYIAFISLSAYVGSLLAHGARRIVVAEYRRSFSNDTILASRTSLERGIIVAAIMLAWLGLLGYLGSVGG